VLLCYVQFIGVRALGTYGIKAFKYYQIEIQFYWNQSIYYTVVGHENVQYFNTEMLCSCITFVHTLFHRQINYRNEIKAQYFRIQTCR
jgi:hypothetical protein